MYAIYLEWKEFNIDIGAVETWMRTNAGEFYCGSSADTKLTLWFTENPGSTIEDMCLAYWAALDDESAEATSYISQAAVRAAILALKNNLHTKEWTDMTVAERKLLTGQTPTRADLGL